MNRLSLSPAALYKMQPSPNIYFIVLTTKPPEIPFS